MMGAGLSPPLYLSSMPRSGPVWATLAQIVATERVSPHEDVSPEAFLNAMLAKITHEAGLAANTTFTVQSRQHESTTPQPLCLSTARQLGLVPTPGIPPILEVCDPTPQPE